MQNYGIWRIILLLAELLWLSPKGATGQNAAPDTLQLLWEQPVPAALAQEVLMRLRTEEPGSNDALVLDVLRSKGYWLASIDSVYSQERVKYYQLYLGAQYGIAELSYPVVEEAGQTDIITKRFGKARGQHYLRNLSERGVRKLADQGYPFARWDWEISRIEGQRVALQARINKGPYIVTDSLILTQPVISKVYLQRLTGLELGEAYRESAFARSSQVLRQLPFLQVDGAPTASFDGNGALLTYPLKQRKVNRLEFFLGLLPAIAEGGGALVTGELHLALHNLGKTGKYLQVDWQSVKERSPTLNLVYEHPYPFGTRLKLRVAGALLKEDTLFVNRSLELGLGWQAASRLELGLIGNLRGTSLLTNARQAAEQAQQQVSNSGFELGARLVYRGLDDPVIPRKGVRVRLQSTFGQRRVAATSPLDTGSNGYAAFRFAAELEQMVYLNATSGLRVQVSGRYLDAGQLFFNDLYRLGGLTSLRGFNQNSFFASRSLVGQLEWRLHTTEGSLFYLFTDMGFLGYRLSNALQFDETALGMGLGMQLKTGGGLLNLSWALGQTRQEAFSLVQSVFHIGYKARF